MSSTPRDPTDDFVAQLLLLIARCTGGMEEQQLMQLEEQIRAEYGAQEVYIHRAAWFDRRTRDECVRQDRRNGRSLGEIAIKYGISRSRARQICEGDEPA